MNGELALSFSLATYGSAWLAGGGASGPAPSEWARTAHPFVAALSFGEAGGVSHWLDGLAAGGADRVWLAIPALGRPADGDPPWHVRAAFAGGVPAGLLTTGDTGNDLWTASWNVGDRDAPDRRVWNVVYRPARVGFGPQRPGVADAATALDAVLARAEEFAARHDLAPWPAVFRKARARPPAASVRSHQNLFPGHHYGEASRRLAAGAGAAWVFGGMGSWNDLPYLGEETHAEYERLSGDLFAAIMTALVAAANADLADRHEIHDQK